jgi:hypothetical protein
MTMILTRLEESRMLQQRYSSDDTDYVELSDPDREHREARQYCIGYIYRITTPEGLYAIDSTTLHPFTGLRRFHVVVEDRPLYISKDFVGEI